MAIRVTQIPTQTAEEPTDTRLRVTELAAHTAQAPINARLRVTQMVLLVAEPVSPFLSKMPMMGVA